MSATEQDEATGWLARVNDPDFTDWDGLEGWLAADPARRDAFVALARREQELVRLCRAADREEPLPFPDRQAPGGRRWQQALGALAAALLLVVAASLWHPRAVAGEQRLATLAGERRTVGLEDGSRIELAGATVMRVSSDGRRARLERGRALFSIRHAPNRPFVLAVGGASITDLGTRFEVTRTPGGMRVAVAEGEVRLARGAARLDLSAGEAAVMRADTVSLGRIAPASVGAWQAGRLRFDDAGVGTVAEEVGGALGIPIEVDPVLAARRLSGSVALGGVEPTVARLAQLLGARAERSPRGWRLVAADRGA